MIVLSLFDGISCARMALERAGIKVDKYYASEIDKWAIAVSKKNYPDIIHLGDIKDVNGLTFHGISRPRIDLLVGGFPCQDLSIAKKDRKGLSGEKSGLFYEMIRIHKEIKPKWFIYENVASMAKENKEIILNTLKEIDKNAYVIEINGALVSAQNRRRLFFTNIIGITQPEDKGILLKDILEQKVDEKFYIKDKSNTIRTSGRGSGIDDRHNWDTIRIGSINKGGQGDRIYSTEGKSVNLSANGGGRGAKTGLYAVKDIVRKLTCVECERLTTLPDDFTKYGINEKGEEILISNSQRYKMCGNAFLPDVISWILKFIK